MEPFIARAYILEIEGLVDEDNKPQIRLSLK